MPAPKISAKRDPRAGDFAAENFEDRLRRRLERPRGAGLTATLTFLLPNAYLRLRSVVKQHPHKSPHSGAAITFYRKCKCLKSLAPRVGFEPTTLRLTAECSTIELPRNDLAQALSLEQTPPSAVNFDGFFPPAEPCDCLTRKRSCEAGWSAGFYSGQPCSS